LVINKNYADMHGQQNIEHYTLYSYITNIYLVRYDVTVKEELRENEYNFPQNFKL
jgi:hypothetical protein